MAEQCSAVQLHNLFCLCLCLCFCCSDSQLTVEAGANAVALATRREERIADFIIFYFTTIFQSDCL